MKATTTYRCGQGRQPTSGLVRGKDLYLPLAQRMPASELHLRGDAAELGEAQSDGECRLWSRHLGDAIRDFSRF